MVTFHPPPDAEATAQDSEPDTDAHTTGPDADAASFTGTVDKATTARPAAYPTSGTGDPARLDAPVGTTEKITLRPPGTGLIAGLRPGHLLLTGCAAVVIALTAHQVGTFITDGPVLPPSRINPEPVPTATAPEPCILLCSQPHPAPGECVLCDPASPGPTRVAELLGAVLRAAGGH